MRTEHLVSEARVKPWGVYASGKRWHAYRNGGGNVVIRHHATDMVEVTPNGEVLPISRGYGSVSDKQGLNKVFRYERAFVTVDGEKVPATYNTVFG